MSNNFHDIETQSLPAHVSICQERYKHLESRLNHLDERLDKIDLYLKEIYQKMDGLSQKHYNKWDAVQTAAIAGMVSIMSMLLISRFVG